MSKNPYDEIPQENNDLQDSGPLPATDENGSELLTVGDEQVGFINPILPNAPDKESDGLRPDKPTPLRAEDLPLIQPAPKLPANNLVNDPKGKVYLYYPDKSKEEDDGKDHDRLYVRFNIDSKTSIDRLARPSDIVTYPDQWKGFKPGSGRKKQVW